MRALAYGLVVWTGILSGIAVLRLARFEHEAMKILNVLEAPPAVSVATPEGSDRSSTPQQQTYTRVQGTALIASRLRLLTGYQPNPEEMDANEHPRIEQLHFRAPLQTSYVSPVADSFDGHITSWAGCPYQPVRNQGACGACYAFVVADAGRVALCRDAKRSEGDHAGNVPMLSPQVQVSCDASTKGCEGGSLFQAILWIAHVGSTWESCVPYSSQEGAAPPCHSFHCSLAANDTACPRPRIGLDAVFVPHTDVAAIKWYISNVGPAIIGMTVHESFLLYDSGYYRAYDDDGALIVPNDKVHSAHAVVVVGYEYVRFQGEAASASRLAWICRNSWGLDWGENGFFRVFDSDRVHGAMFRYPRGALFLQKD
jgi:cathepsin B